MGQSTPASFSTPAGASTQRFLVGQDPEGHWIVRAANGLIGGLFATKQAAIRFACFETGRAPDAVLFVPEHIKLSLSGALPRF